MYHWLWGMDARGDIKCQLYCIVLLYDIHIINIAFIINKRVSLQLQSTLTSLERRVSALENTRQSKTVCKHESSVAENDIIEMPGPGVNSLRNSPAQETNQGDSGSLKRRSLAAGIYVTSSPKTSKRAKVHK